jgi:hypothetical protein
VPRRGNEPKPSSKEWYLSPWTIGD